MRPRLLVAALLLALAMPVPAARALPGEKITFKARPGAKTSKTYSTPMATSDTLGLLTDPEGCTASPGCTMVPIDILAPKHRGLLEEWVVNVRVEWPAENVETEFAGDQNSSDIDTSIYSLRPDTSEDAEPGATEYVEVARSWSGANPEIMDLYRPTELDYYLVAQNFAGVVPEFTVRVKFKDLTYVPPDFSRFDRDVPTPPFVAPPVTTPTTQPPAEPSSDGGSRAALGGDRRTTPTTVGFERLDAGDELAVSGRDDFDDLLSGPVRHSLFAREEAAPPEPVSGGTVAVWLTLFPLAVLGLAAAVLWRIRPAALSVISGRARRG
jgi:hypothetical protein